jgi:hypothetical protein
MIISGTRIALGAGVGLLIAGKLSDEARKATAWALIAVGALSSVPIVIGILGKPQVAERP